MRDSPFKALSRLANVCVVCVCVRKKECGEYYLCIEGEVFDFKCSTGLKFDIKRQICDRAVINQSRRVYQQSFLSGKKFVDIFSLS